MKKILVSLILLMGLVFPWACSDNHSPSNPSGPSLGSGGSTPVGTSTPGTFTSTPTQPAGANTFTPTPTFVLAAPVFQSNFSTSAAPHGMVIAGGELAVAENELRATGIVSEKERYSGVGTAALNLYGCGGPCVGNGVEVGCPPPVLTPGTTPVVYIPFIVGLNQIQGYVNPGGDVGAGAWSAVLDLTPGGGASLYCGYLGDWNDPGQGVFLDNNYEPFDGNGYGGIPFNNPQAMCADTTGGTGSIYITDTGNGYVDQMSPYDGLCPDPGLPIHRWNGTAGVTVGGGVTPVTFSAPSVTFKSPTAIACDAAGNVWVGDQGYTPSYIMEFTSGATTILESWQTVANCKVSGIAVNTTNGNVYIADSGNNLVEEYSASGTLLTDFGDPGPAAHELHPFLPTCIAFSGTYVYVGDAGNDYIDVFQ